MSRICDVGMKRVSLGRRYEEERVRVWMPRVRRMRRDSSVFFLFMISKDVISCGVWGGWGRGGI